ncbi:SPOR domain-containing protein [uncultured Desulfovibrio sp.]|uniref:SPOR domain-containing protein n=1 Tax=uncultured Desulfovibrio sp. TaxID=167968 RepID=UPI0026254812|nr:SPOR domain-containing protein [uncultured Desulfovibrio sp.]
MSPASRLSTSGHDSPKGALRLRPSSLVAACFLVLAAIVLSYVGGVMSGRTYAVRHATPAGTVCGGTERQSVPNGDNPVAAPVAQSVEAVRDGADAGQRILAPEDLRFARALRNDNAAQGTPEPAASAQPPVAVNGTSAPTAVLAAPLAPAVSEGQTPPSVPVATMFDYVFQVGAFKDEESVDSLRQRLEGRGLRTRMQCDGKLFLVLVLLRGDASRAAEVSQITEELHLGQPILRSRKPAMP